jgi:hypothetical protein
LKKEDVLQDVVDDDEVRTTASQECVISTMCTEEFFLMTWYI